MYWDEKEGRAGGEREGRRRINLKSSSATFKDRQGCMIPCPMTGAGRKKERIRSWERGGTFWLESAVLDVFSFFPETHGKQGRARTGLCVLSYLLLITMSALCSNLPPCSSSSPSLFPPSNFPFHPFFILFFPSLFPVSSFFSPKVQGTCLSQASQLRGLQVGMTGRLLVTAA